MLSPVPHSVNRNFLLAPPLQRSCDCERYESVIASEARQSRCDHRRRHQHNNPEPTRHSRESGNPEIPQNPLRVSDTHPLTNSTSVLYTVLHVEQKAPWPGPAPDTGQIQYRVSRGSGFGTLTPYHTVKNSRIYMQRRLAPEDALLIVMAETGTAGVTTAPRGSQPLHRLVERHPVLDTGPESRRTGQGGQHAED